MSPPIVNNNNIYSLHCLTQRLLPYDEAGLSSELYSRLDLIAAKACQEIREKSGMFLHSLDENIHTEEQVQAVIDACPESLSFTDKDGRLPIQSAADWHEREHGHEHGRDHGSSSCTISPPSCMPVNASRAIKFIPLLAREGNRRNVAGEDCRGGLLTNVFCGFDMNIIQFLSCVAAHNENGEEDVDPDCCDRVFEIKCLQALKDLRTIGLLRKEDVHNYGLLFLSADPKAQHRFDFFTQWYPQGLKGSKQKESQVPLIHATIEINSVSDAKKRFEIVLKACVRYFPPDLGYFLSLEHEGNIVCKAGIDRFGRDETLAIICRSIPLPQSRVFLMSGESNFLLMNRESIA